jgi:hypothetical protein
MTRIHTVKISGIVILCIFLALSACTPKRFKELHPIKKKTKISEKTVKKTLKRMGYTIQAGAFANPDNAVRFSEVLRSRGLDATYFAAQTGLYKVRFGNFKSKDAARKRAISLKEAGVIEEFYIVVPEEYSVTKSEKLGDDQIFYLRDEIVKSAHTFIDVPYLWGGTSAETGFDCSGLTMTVYQLNGLDLPRNSAEQFAAGNTIEKDNLMKGDLVFFATTCSNRISHVGIYIGDGLFIHAPSKGKTIRKDSLSDSYWLKRYVGSCTYL